MTESAAATSDPKTLDRVSQARSEVVRLHEIEQSWSRKIQHAVAELARLGVESGEAVLAASLAGDGDDALRVQAQRVSVLRAEIETQERAVDAARRQRALAIAAIHTAEAAEFRAKAPALQAEIASRTSKTNELLAALKAHEGVDYVPYEPAPRSVHVYDDSVTYHAIPRTRALMAQLGEIERNAQAAEQRTVRRNGQVSASSIDELVTLATSDPTIIGPTLRATLEFAETASKVELARQSRIRGDTTAAERPLQWTLTWIGGVIEPSQSRAAAVRPFVSTGQIPAGGRVQRRSEKAND